MQFPEICSLDAKTTMQEIRKKAPFYVPEWNAGDEEDFGVVLSNIFSRMVDLISGNLNEAPKKHFLSFLELINTSLIPASPARAPLTFMLSEGTPEDVFIDASTQVSAEDSSGNKVIFETERPIFATPVKLVSVYSVISKLKEENKKENEDKIFRHTAAVNGVKSRYLFTGDSLQKHVLYIGDEHLFDVQKGQITIDFGVGKVELEKLDTDWGIVEWMYSAGTVTKEDGEKEINWQRLKTELKAGKLTLSTNEKQIEKVKLNEIESRWLKCQLKASKIEELKDLKIKLNVSTSPKFSLSDSSGIVPDYLFNNDIPIDPASSSFYPFGKTPYLYDTFYIASRDAFSKKGYNITLGFTLIPESSKNEVDKPHLSWEFWDGETWSLLPIKDDESKKNLIASIISSEPHKLASRIVDTLTIQEMPEAKPTKVNGKENYWIRVRLVSGNYGKEYKIVTPNEKEIHESNNPVRAEVVPGAFSPPELSNLKINYFIGTNTETDPLTRPEYIFTENNLFFENYLEKLEKQSLETKLKEKQAEKEKIEEIFFKPFQPLPDNPPSVYFGFNKPLKKGPFSLFININETIESPESFLPKVKWEYLIDVEEQEIWEEIEVLDETEGFTKKGIVQFILPGEIKASQLFDQEKRYWIRARITGDFFTLPEPSEKRDKSSTSATDSEESNVLVEYSPPEIRGFYLNSVWATQARTISEEIVGSGTGEVNQRFKLINAPVINEKIWINEISTLSEKEKKSLLLEEGKVNLRQNSKGNILEFWVKWDRINDFLDSGNKDRHYMIDRTDGHISFGNGKHGMLPPIGSGNIKAEYSTGGGRSGNLDALKISKLQSSVSFVDKVFNPISSYGGTETEDTASLLKRAPTILRNRGRAITFEDYEQLAKEASEEVARVKAFPNLEPGEAPDMGRVTLVIVPESSNAKPVPTSELKRRVALYLKERCSAAVNLRVISPHYVNVEVYAEIVSASIDALPSIEKEARQKISEFLHPLRGNTDKKGWNFGCTICISDIYSVLKEIKAISYVKKVNVNLYEKPGVTDPDAKLDEIRTIVALSEEVLPYSGEHEIKVEWKNQEEV